jgi:3-oxoadipate enol-lactonase
VTPAVRDVLVNGVRVRVEEEGFGREAIVFSHGMLRDRRMFDAQVATLRDRYRCIRYDHRGQGETEAPRDSVIELETVYDDAVCLLQELGVGACHWVGLSMGGMVGMRLAARRPDLLRSLVLLETSAERDRLWLRIQSELSLATLGILGPRLASKIVLGSTMRLFYGTTFRRDATRRSEYTAERSDFEKKLQTTPSAVIRGVLARDPIVDALPSIHLPTLVIVGAEDVLTPPDTARRLTAGIAGARLELVAGAGHTSTVEQPGAVTAVIADFIDRLPR